MNPFSLSSPIPSAPPVTPGPPIAAYQQWGYPQWPSQAQPFPPYPPAFHHHPVHQPSVFHNQFQATYDPQEPQAYRIALGDISQDLNQLQEPSEATGTKRRRNNTSGSNKKRNTGTATSADASMATTTPIIIPSIGLILEAVQQDEALHPALSRLHTDPGSLLHEESVSLANASDIWYFMRGQNTKADEAVPVNDLLVFTYLVLRMCVYMCQLVWLDMPGSAI